MQVIAVVIYTIIIVNLVAAIVFLNGSTQMPQTNATKQNNTVTTPSPVQVPTTQSVTRAQLAEHDTQEDCWISYEDKVYDITSWLPQHPGSASAIAPYCGTAEEFEQAFTGQHGSSQARKLTNEGIYKGELQ